MIDDMYMFLYEYKNLDTFVIVSCDSDFVVAVRRLKMNNKQVIIVGDNENTSQLLKATCDEFINVNYLPSKFNKDDLVSEINDIFDQFNTEEIYLGRLTETLKMRDSTFNPKKYKCDRMVDLIKKLKKHFDLVRDDKLNPFVRRK